MNEDTIRRAHAVCPLTAIQNRYSMMARWHEKLFPVLEDRLADVWLTSMESYREFEKFSKCSRCKLLAWCRGCPAVAKGTYGDFYADDPQCWASEENGLLRSVAK